MTIDKALSLTAKLIPDHLAQNFFGTMRSHLREGTGATLAEAFIDWCETHKERLTAESDGLDFHPLVGWRDLEEQHNPDGLDASTVGTGDGWRLLNKSEISPKSADKFPLIDELYTWQYGTWRPGSLGILSGCTYRTRLTPEELAAKRKEAK